MYRMRLQPNFWGYFYLALAEFAVGVGVVSGKFTAEYMHPFVFIGGRFLIGSLMLGATMLLFKKRFISVAHPTGKLSGYEWTWMLIQGLTGGMLFNVVFYFGVSLTSATSAGIIGSTLPAIATLCAYFILKETLNIQKVAALGLAVLGIMIIGLDNPHGSEDATGSYLGDILVFIAMFPEAMYMIFAKKLSNRVTSLGSATAVNVFGLIGILPFFIYGLLQTDLSVIPQVTWIALFLGGMSGVVFFWAWPQGLSFSVPMTTAALFGGLMPVFTAIIAYFFLSEVFTIYNAIGMLCVFASIGLGAGLGRYLFKRRARYYGA